MWKFCQSPLPIESCIWPKIQVLEVKLHKSWILYGDKNSSAWNKITNKSWILYGAKNKVPEVKLHMSLDASQMLYGIHDYPPSGLH
jgi:hypothetical protein